MNTAAFRQIVLALPVCWTWLLGGSAWAQGNVRKGDVEVGMDLGWAGFGSDSVRGNGSRLSVHGGYAITDRLELEGDITCLGGRERALAANTAFTLCTGGVGGVFNILGHARLSPYVRLGVGQSQLDRGAESGGFDIQERSAALRAGTGTRVAFGTRKRLALRVDASWLRTRFFGEWSTQASLALGVVYRIAPER